MLSTSQAKLHAIMAKMSDVLPFLSDVDCDRAFDVLSSIAQVVLDQRSSANITAFSEMTLNELIALKQS